MNSNRRLRRSEQSGVETVMLTVLVVVLVVIFILKLASLLDGTSPKLGSRGVLPHHGVVSPAVSASYHVAAASLIATHWLPAGAPDPYQPPCAFSLRTASPDASAVNSGDMNRCELWRFAKGAMD
jgi:hypothetical protein